jgi:hypothetical protein
MASEAREPDPAAETFSLAVRSSLGALIGPWALPSLHKGPQTAITHTPNAQRHMRHRGLMETLARALPSTGEVP